MQNLGSLALCNELLRGLSLIGLEAPGDLLPAAVPLASKGQDLVIYDEPSDTSALAYVLPALQRLRRDGRTPKILIIAPTPDRVRAIARLTAAVGRPMAVTCEVAGHDHSPPSDVLVGLPDLLLERLEAGDLELAGISALAVDGLDEVLTQGFGDDLVTLLKAAGPRRLTLFTAREATPAIDEFLTYTRNPVVLDAEALARQAEHVPVLAIAPVDDEAAGAAHQYLVVPSEENRIQAVLALLQQVDAAHALLFVRTRAETKEFASRLRQEGIPAGRLNGDMTAVQKNRTIKMFQDGELKVLVATDAADRDLGPIDLVIHVAVPPTVQHYERKSRHGDRVITLVVPETELAPFSAVQRSYHPVPLGDRVPEPPEAQGRDRGRGRRGRGEAPRMDAPVETRRRRSLPPEGAEPETASSSILTNSLVDSLPPLASTPRRRRGRGGKGNEGGRVFQAGSPVQAPAADQRVRLTINLGMVNQFASSELADLLAQRTGRPIPCGPVHVEEERTLFYVPQAEAPRIIDALDRIRDEARGMDIRVNMAAP